MSLNQAFAIRVRKLLGEKKMTQYKLEQLTGLYHSTMSYILNYKVKASNFNTMALIIRELGVTISEFFDDPIFDFVKQTLAYLFDESHSLFFNIDFSSLWLFTIYLSCEYSMIALLSSKLPIIIFACLYVKLNIVLICSKYIISMLAT